MDTNQSRTNIAPNGDDLAAMTEEQLYAWVGGWGAETANHLAGKTEIDFRQSVRVMK